MRFFRNKKKTVVLASLTGHIVRVGSEWKAVPEPLVSQALAARCEERKDSEDDEQATASPDFIKKKQPKEQPKEQSAYTLEEVKGAIAKIDKMLDAGKEHHGKLKLLTAQGIPNALVVGSILGKAVKKEDVLKVLEHNEDE
jgi:hypothetical protein